MNIDLKNGDVENLPLEGAKSGGNHRGMSEDDAFVAKEGGRDGRRITREGEIKVGVNGENFVAGSEVRRQWPNVSERVFVDWRRRREKREYRGGC